MQGGLCFSGVRSAKAKARVAHGSAAPVQRNSFATNPTGLPVIRSSALRGGSTTPDGGGGEQELGAKLPMKFRVAVSRHASVIAVARMQAFGQKSIGFWSSCTLNLNSPPARLPAPSGCFP